MKRMHLDFLGRPSRVVRRGWLSIGVAVMLASVVLAWRELQLVA